MIRPTLVWQRRWILGALLIFIIWKFFLISLWKKVAVIALYALVVYLPVTAYLHHPWRPYTLERPAIGNVLYLPSDTRPQRDSTASIIDEPQPNLEQGLINFRNDYLNWLFPHWTAYALFAWFCLLLFRFKQTNVLAIYFATLLATVMAAALYPQGNRALVLLWPFTFLLYGFGFWYTYSWLRQHHSPPWRYLVGTSSVLLANFVNHKDTMNFTPEFASYLHDRIDPSDSVISYDKAVISMILNTELVTHPQSNAKGESHYLILLLPPPTATARTPLDQFFAIATTLFRGSASPVYQAPIFSDSVAQEPSGPKAPPNFRLMRQFDTILVYENMKYGS